MCYKGKKASGENSPLALCRVEPVDSVDFARSTSLRRGPGGGEGGLLSLKRKENIDFCPVAVALNSTNLH